MKFQTISVKSHRREELIDISREVNDFARNSNIQNGKITLFVPHTTAAVTINENADPDVPHDIILGLSKIVPHFSGFRHGEGNSDAHLKSSLVSCTQDIFIQDGRLVLGTWQGIFFCEFDGPRHRRLIIGIEGE